MDVADHSRDFESVFLVEVHSLEIISLRDSFLQHWLQHFDPMSIDRWLLEKLVRTLVHDEDGLLLLCP
jgi:hypothetical protein